MPTEPRERGTMNNNTEYKIQIDKDIYSVDHPLLTGRELLEVAKKTPAEQFAIYLKAADGPPRRIGLDEKLDLRQPGVDCFLTLPLDQTEGLNGRRDFNVPEVDQEWLENTGLRYELVSENGALRLVLYGFPLPNGYDRRQVRRECPHRSRLSRLSDRYGICVSARDSGRWRANTCPRRGQFRWQILATVEPASDPREPVAARPR